MEREHRKLKKIVRQASGDRQAAEQRRTIAMMNALKTIHSATVPASMKREDLEHQRKGQDVLGRLITPMLGMSWEPFSLHSIPAAWVRPERGHDKRHVILYCHGGGYTSGSLGYSRPLASKLANVTGYEVLAFAYRLAPEYPYPAAVKDALEMWDYLMHLGYGARDVVLVGDSAGGNLALVLTLALRDAGRMLPGRLVLMSPWTDMTMAGASYLEHQEDDPMLTREYIEAVRSAYAPEGNWTAGALSPVFADLTGFPPTLIQVGSNEILQSDSVSLRDKLIADAVPCCLEIWPDMWHTFQMFPTKKAAEAMERVGHFLLDYV